MNWHVFWLVFFFLGGTGGSAFLYHLMSSFVRLSARSSNDSIQARYLVLTAGLSILWLVWTSLWVSGVVTSIIILKGEL